MRAAGSSASKLSKDRSTKRSDKAVLFDEMRRLVRVYGPVKCLCKRKRKGAEEGRDNGGAEDAKVANVKRKFYRWFPDFEKRFERVVSGEGGEPPHYRPKSGHKFEMNHRKERRREDSKLITQKRVRC